VIRDLATALRFAATGELPAGHPGRGDRLLLGAPVPVLHTPVLEAAPPGWCMRCTHRPGHWRHGGAGRALEKLRRTSGMTASRAVRT
jgi:hypothetical protein